MTRTRPALPLAALLLAAPVLAAPVLAAKPSVAAAVADPARPAEDRALDAQRKPAEMLRFAGVKPGMTVVDVIPGGGYFTRLFADAVGPAGKVIAYVPDEMLKRSTKPLDRATAAAAGHANVAVAHDPLLSPTPSGIADIVWTAQNYHDLHNLPGLDVVAFDRAVLASLKPGGVFVVVDHAARPGSGLAATGDLHRIDPAAVRQEVEAAGFVFDGESRVLANPADAHDKTVFDPAIRHMTDQFAFRFRKPGAAR